MNPSSRDNHQPQVADTVHNGRQQTTPRAEKPAFQPQTLAGVEQAVAPVHTAEVTEQESTVKSEVQTPEVQESAVITDKQNLVLPPSVISRADIGRCLREIEKIDSFFHQEGLRGRKDQPLPTVSRKLEGLAIANGLNLIHADARATLKDFLSKLKAKAPSVHMSFPSEASDDFKGKLLEWFRREVHPHIVLNVGLQPELAAGCTLRTTNKFYDFSFRHRFEQSKRQLVEALIKLDEEAGPIEDTIAAEAAAQAQQPQEVQA